MATSHSGYLVLKTEETATTSCTKGAFTDFERESPPEPVMAALKEMLPSFSFAFSRSPARVSCIFAKCLL